MTTLLTKTLCRQSLDLLIFGAKRVITPAFLLATALAVSSADEKRTGQEQVKPSSFGEEVEVTVANLDVFVRDSEGRPVEGLSAEDFRVLQDGIEMPISNFAALFSELPEKRHLATLPDDVTEQTAVNAASPIRPVYVVLHIDNENLQPLNRNRVLKRVWTFVEETLVDPVQMMVVSSRRSLEIRQSFTDDPNLVFGALQSLAKESGARMVRDAERQKIMRDMERFARDAMRIDYRQLLDSIEGRVAKATARGQILAYAEEESAALEDALANMHEVVRLVSSMEGRRSIVYVSSGLPMTPGLGLMHEYAKVFLDNSIYARQAQRDHTQEFRLLANAANREGVSMNTIDASGLTTAEGFSAEDNSYPPEAAASWVTTSNLQEPLNFMADQTGGVTVRNTNDSLAGLRSVADDLFSYYSVGYTISSSDKDTMHRVKVELPNHRDYDIRFRKWLTVKSLDTKIRERVLQTLVKDIGHNPIGLKLTGGDPKPVGGKKRWEVPFSLSIPFNSLALEADADDLVAYVELFFCVRDAQGAQTPTQSRDFEVRIPAARFNPEQEQRYEIKIQLLFKEEQHVVAVGMLDRSSRQSSYTRTMVEIP